MSNFSPELHKAASGAKSLPINKERIDDPSFVTPVYEEYAAKSDITGYMTALWKGVAVRDVECLQVLIYLAVKAHEPKDALDLIDMLRETGDQAMIDISEHLCQIVQDEKEWPDSIFDAAEPTLLRAYLNNVGRQSNAEAPNDEIPINNCVPEETKNYWRGLYRRDDCSSNQEAIYHEALSYAQKGDPFAMYMVGYLLKHGIRTKYSNPNVTILEADHDKAYPWLKRAADADIPEACWETASVLFDKKDPENEALGWKYVEQGAEKDNKDCLLCLFRHYEDKDAVKAFGYLVRLADQYHTHEYTLKLAKWYEEGRGCEKNEKKAFELAEYVYKHSSSSPYDSSHEDSVDLLCRYLKNGIGCEEDYDRALRIQREFHDDEDRMWELLTK